MEAASAFGHRRLRIGALLLKSGLLDAEQLADALDEKEESGERLGEIVVRRGWVTDEAFAHTLADQLQLEFVELDEREARAELLLSGKLARYFRCIPVRMVDEQTVLVATADPTSPRLADLPSALGLEVHLALATESAIERTLALLDPEGAPPQQAEPPAPEPEAVAPEPEPVAPKPEAVAPEPEPVAPKPEAVAPEPEPVAPEPEAVAPEPEAVAPEPEPAVVSELPAEPMAELAAEPEPEPPAEPEPAAAVEEPLPRLKIVGTPPADDTSDASPAPVESELEPAEPVAAEPPAEPVDVPVAHEPVPFVAPVLKRAPVTPIVEPFPVEPVVEELPFAPAAAEEPVAEEPVVPVEALPDPEPDDLTPVAVEALPDAEPELAPVPDPEPEPAPAEQPLLEAVPVEEPAGEDPAPDLFVAEAPAPYADESDTEPAPVEPLLPEQPFFEAVPAQEPAAEGPAPDLFVAEAPAPYAEESDTEPAPVEPLLPEQPLLEAVPADEPEELAPQEPPAELFAIDTSLAEEQLDGAWSYADLVALGEPDVGELSFESAAAASEPVVAETEAEVAEPEAEEPAAGLSPVLDLTDEPAATVAPAEVAPVETPAAESAAAPAGALVPLHEHRRPQLGTLLLRSGFISPEELSAALLEREQTGERLGVILIRSGRVTAKELARALAEQHGLEFIDLGAVAPNAAVATLLPERYARRYGAVPVRFVAENVLLVAVGDPTDVLTSDELRLVLGKGLQLAVATEDDIAQVLGRLYGDAEEPVGPIESAAEEEVQVEVGTRSSHVEVLSSTESAPAVDFVNEVIKRAIQEGASDIHFESQEERLVARIRVDGVMHDLRSATVDLKQAIGARLKVMGELDIAERRAPQDGRVTILFGGKPVDLRIAILPTIHGEQTVIRILYRSSQAVGFEELGLATDTADAIRRAIHQPYGIVLSVGPTGSGKTTTLYAALGLLNDPERCLMTIEDPVEYQLEGLNQIQINTKAGLTFAAGLRTILRSDPDVLLVGEIRDAETARIAVQAAMTGHLVLSTLHADNVGTAVSRLVDMGVERQLLASTVNCILAQRLARRLCAACREPYEASPAELVETGLDAASVPDSGQLVLYRAKGCGQCHSGYKGRLGLFETLAATPKVRHLVETSTAEQIYAAAVADGMRTLQADGVRLALEGLTSLDEVRRVAGERRI